MKTNALIPIISVKGLKNGLLKGLNKNANKVIKIKKEIYPEILPNTYFLNFDCNYENYCFTNFESIDEVKNFIKEKGILNLYNEWLDFICNPCYVCEDEKEANDYQIIKVINVYEDTLEVEIIK